MMRVVDVLPGREEIKAAGLVENNFRIDPGSYRHFVEQFRRDFVAFERTFSGNARTEDGAADPSTVTGSIEPARPDGRSSWIVLSGARSPEVRWASLFTPNARAC